MHRSVTVVFPLLSTIISPPRKYARFVDWSFLCCFKMPCQVVCYPTSFLQAIQTVEASTGALPLTTPPHNCSALKPSLTAQGMWWLSAGLSRSSESLPCWGQTLNRRVLRAQEMLWASSNSWTAARCHADVAGMPREGQLHWQGHCEKPVCLGKWDEATGLQHHWKITVSKRG